MTCPTSEVQAAGREFLTVVTTHASATTKGAPKPTAGVEHGPGRPERPGNTARDEPRVLALGTFELAPDRATDVAIDPHWSIHVPEGGVTSASVLHGYAGRKPGRSDRQHAAGHRAACGPPPASRPSPGLSPGVSTSPERRPAAVPLRRHRRPGPRGVDRCTATRTPRCPGHDAHRRPERGPPVRHGRRHAPEHQTVGSSTPPRRSGPRSAGSSTSAPTSRPAAGKHRRGCPTRSSSTTRTRP
jgi:hypothetical protein